MDNDERKVISFQDYKNARVLGELRKYPDYYEYMLIPNYEDLFAELKMQSVEMEDCFANLLVNDGRYVLVSLSFDESYTVDDILDWLDICEIILKEPTNSLIQVNGVSEIIEAIKFQDYLILLVEKGTDSFTLDPNELDEITDSYSSFDKISNTGMADVVEWKDGYLGSEYPGGSDESEGNFETLKKSIHYSADMRGLFIDCKKCMLLGVVIHDRTFEIERPVCPYCGEEVDGANCEWINGPI
ncbi:hypothetical protein [Solibacillus sp. FSL H8-0538]|uniref:hypothetical protein n=1 Tax=Solibacillus sp. FSL H8-0538 TaxID=2921400 RepID=UPI0030FB1462